jgi:hypothetical protein
MKYEAPETTVTSQSAFIPCFLILICLDDIACHCHGDDMFHVEHLARSAHFCVFLLKKRLSRTADA